MNYRSEGPMENVTVRVDVPKGRAAKSVTLASPEHVADINLAFQQRSGVVTFTVPTVGVYEIAVVAF